MNHRHQKSTLALLVERYCARPVIYTHEAAGELGRGLSPKAASAAASRGHLPVPTIKIGRRRMVRLVDLADALDKFAAAAGLPVAAAPEPAKPRRGRPRLTPVLAHPEMLGVPPMPSRGRCAMAKRTRDDFITGRAIVAEALAGHRPNTEHEPKPRSRTAADLGLVLRNAVIHESRCFTAAGNADVMVRERTEQNVQTAHGSALGGRKAGAQPPEAQRRGPGGAASERSRARAERAPKGPVAKWGAKPPTPAQAGQPVHVDHDESQDRSRSESGRVARPAAGVAASLAEARSPNGTKASAQGSASASERGEIARQRGDSAAPQGEHVAFRRPPEQAHAIREIETRFLGSTEDRVMIDATTDGGY